MSRRGSCTSLRRPSFPDTSHCRRAEKVSPRVPDGATARGPPTPGTAGLDEVLQTLASLFSRR